MLIAVFAAVAILIAAAVVHVFREERKKRARRIEELRNLSFSALENPPQEVVELLTSLHRNEHRKDLRPRDIHERRGEGYRLYLYDMFDYSGESVSAIVTAGVAVHSEKLALPLFTIVCKFEGTGFIATVAKTAMDRLIAMAGSPLDFSQYPDFHRKYYVLGRDEPAIRSLLREPVLSLLAEKAWRTVNARGNAFAYDRRDSYDYGNRRKVEVGTKEKLLEALELFRVLTEKEDAGEVTG